MSNETIPTHEFHPKQIMSALFRRESLAERFHRILAGLRAPHESGAYKYARLQILRLQAPVAGVVVPVLVLLLLLWLSQLAGREIGPTDGFKILPEPDPLPELDPVEPLPESPDMALPGNPAPDLAAFDVQPTAPDIEPSLPQPQIDAQATWSPFKLPISVRRLGADTFSDKQARALVGKGGSPQTEDAVRRALRWLQAVQDSDGSWSLESGGGPGTGATPAMTGLALLTFLAHNETTGSPVYGATVQRGLSWMVENQQPDGGFNKRDSHDYSHPIAAYALCEAYAMMRLPMLKEPAKKSIDVIIKGQHASGAWDYNCKQSTRDDTSYTGWCVQALKAAQIARLENAGLERALRQAVDGLRINAAAGGGFGYTAPQSSHLTGVGVLCLQLLGAAKAQETRLGLAWLEQASFNWSAPWGNSPLYYWYYVTQAKFHAGGDTWNRWNEQMKASLVRSQSIVKGQTGTDMGYWQACSETEHCKSYVYNTTLAALMLQVYYRHLATFTQPDNLPDTAFDRNPDDIQVAVKE